MPSKRSQWGCSGLLLALRLCSLVLCSPVGTAARSFRLRERCAYGAEEHIGEGMVHGATHHHGKEKAGGAV